MNPRCHNFFLIFLLFLFATHFGVRVFICRLCVCIIVVWRRRCLTGTPNAQHYLNNNISVTVVTTCEESLSFQHSELSSGVWFVFLTWFLDWLVGICMCVCCGYNNSNITVCHMTLEDGGLGMRTHFGGPTNKIAVHIVWQIIITWRGGMMGIVLLVN